MKGKNWKEIAKGLRTEIHALGLACADPRTPWYAKLLATLVVGYALSPVDLIPDFIPVLGYIDDLILLPAGIYLVIRVIPGEVMAECREKARGKSTGGKARWAAAAVIVFTWLLVIFWLAWLILKIAF